MTLKLYNASLILITALISCGSNNSNDYIDKSLVPPVTESKTAITDTTPVVPTYPAQVISAQPGNTVIPATVNPGVAINPANAQPAAQVTAPGMNPPHGQPGHRCDISVGAPLNSKPTQPVSQPSATVSTPQPQATAPGMNPPHGQPGHRCEIAVGAPLNSKPVQQTQQPAITIQKQDSVKN